MSGVAMPRDYTSFLPFDLDIRMIPNLPAEKADDDDEEEGEDDDDDCGWCLGRDVVDVQGVDLEASIGKLLHIIAAGILRDSHSTPWMSVKKLSLVNGNASSVRSCISYAVRGQLSWCLPLGCRRAQRLARANAETQTGPGGVYAVSFGEISPDWLMDV
jgi:hypothetical protein